MPPSSANFSAGMILPRAMPAMSGMMASTSEMPWSRKNWRISLTIRCSPSPGPGLGAVAAGGAEGREQRARQGVVHHLPLGMPLHRERKPCRAFDSEGFDQAVARARLHREALPETLDALPVQGVDSHLIGSGQRAEEPFRGQSDVVRWPVLHLERQALVVPVIEMPRHLVNALMQAAAEGDVDLLKAAADPEHG